MRFTPKSEQELQNMNLLEPGIYEFQVSSAKNKVSKSGNDMIEVTLNIWNKNGTLHCIYDYLLEIMAFKLRNFCETTGLISKYDMGELNPSDCINSEGLVEIEINEGKLKEDGTRYPSRNAVKDYVKKNNNKVKSNNFIDDDISF